jgi:hypothetical protein
MNRIITAFRFVSAVMRADTAASAATISASASDTRVVTLLLTTAATTGPLLTAFLAAFRATLLLSVLSFKHASVAAFAAVSSFATSDLFSFF